MGNRGWVAAVIGVLVLAAALGLGAGALLAGSGGSGGAGDRGGAAPTSAGGATSPAAGQISATADKTSAASNERITISGQVAGADSGVRVVVQRRENGDWADFPANTTTSSGGRYSVFVQLRREGSNVLRIVAPAQEAESPPITVQIG